MRLLHRKGLARDFTFYDQGRPHVALGGRTPGMVYFASLPHLKEA